MGNVVRNKHMIFLVLFLLGVSLLAGTHLPVSHVQARQQADYMPPAWQAKVDPWVLDTVARQGETEFLLVLAQQADLGGAASLPTRADKGRYVMEALQKTARETQPPVLQALQEMGVVYEPYWIVNMIWVRGTLQAVETLARRADVYHLYANPSVRFSEPVESVQEGRAPAVSPIEKINVLAVWALGYTGQGVVIGGQDTGYKWDHAGLRNQYRGWNGLSVDHNYNWHDAIHAEDVHSPAVNPCGLNLQAPCDDHGHGTHTMGTMAGVHPTPGVYIGVAPGTRWIGCRNMEQGWGTPATYAECYQWFIAPTDLNGENPDPSNAPHIINNSWGCTASEGCTNPLLLKTIVENVRAAGILSVHSAGNEGPACNTVQSPAGIYAASFSVGAVDINDMIASFSSRGPVTVDGSNRLKPDITAPGVSIFSAHYGGGYSYMSGTSMAAPHVAGLAALLISAMPDLAGQVDLLEWLITRSAYPLYSSQGCGGDTPTTLPNHVYGYGRIDALAAYQLLGSLVQTQVSVSGTRLAADTAVLTYTIATSYLDFPGQLRASPPLTVTATLPQDGLLLSATNPVLQVGAVLTWTHPGLQPGEQWVISLVMQTSVEPDGTAQPAAFTYTDNLGQVRVPATPPWRSWYLFLPLLLYQP